MKGEWPSWGEGLWKAVDKKDAGAKCALKSSSRRAKVVKGWARACPAQLVLQRRSFARSPDRFAHRSGRSTLDDNGLVPEDFLKSLEAWNCVRSYGGAREKEETQQRAEGLWKALGRVEGLDCPRESEGDTTSANRASGRVPEVHVASGLRSRLRRRVDRCGTPRLLCAHGGSSFRHEGDGKLQVMWQSTIAFVSLTVAIIRLRYS